MKKAIYPNCAFDFNVSKNLNKSVQETVKFYTNKLYLTNYLSDDFIWPLDLERERRLTNYSAGDFDRLLDLERERLLERDLRSADLKRYKCDYCPPVSKMLCQIILDIRQKKYI